ncbi:hypothetical protein V6N12_010165 [Hibiscus sabdariffa]|uniref:Uncharacterized protein n=1 Tax=Hibiscus sabdariffa TaxID=183260 RepID=A0ABR2ECV7_9ROSI
MFKYNEYSDDEIASESEDGDGQDRIHDMVFDFGHATENFTQKFNAHNVDDPIEASSNSSGEINETINVTFGKSTRKRKRDEIPLHEKTKPLDLYDLPCEDIREEPCQENEELGFRSHEFNVGVEDEGDESDHDEFTSINDVDDELESISDVEAYNDEVDD